MPNLKKCPFIDSSTGPGTCIDLNCSMWIESTTGFNGSTDGYCSIAYTNKNISNLNDRIYSLEKHIHDKHLHAIDHNSNVIKEGPPYGSTKISTPIKIDPVSKLINEITFSMDNDDNGLVYGKDFIINSKDKPYMLTNCEGLITYNSRMFKMTWTDYINSNYPSDVKPYITDVSVYQSDAYVEIILTGKLFYDINYYYPSDNSSNDPYPGFNEEFFNSWKNKIEFSSTNFSDFNFNEEEYNNNKSIWESNRNNKITWEEFINKNVFVVKVGQNLLKYDKLIYLSSTKAVYRFESINDIPVEPGIKYEIYIVDSTNNTVVKDTYNGTITFTS